MAKIIEEQVLITIGRLVREGDVVESLATPELVASLESIAQELIGESAIAEARVIGNK